MPLSLVGTQKFPRSDEPRHPGIDSHGAPILSGEDGSPLRASVKGVAPFHRSSGSETREFNSLAGTGFANLTWTVTVTDSRVLLTAPEVVGMYGGVKSKNGRMSAGQVRYQWLGALAWGVDELWLVTPMAKDQRQDRVGLDRPGEVASELTTRVVAYWKAQGRDTTRLEEALVTFMTEQEPGSAVDIDDLLKSDGEQWGPVSVAP